MIQLPTFMSLYFRCLPGQTKMRHPFPSPKLVPAPQDERLEAPSLLDHLLQPEAARLVLTAHRFPSSSSRAGPTGADPSSAVAPPQHAKSAEALARVRSSGDTSRSSSFEKCDRSQALRRRWRPQVARGRRLCACPALPRSRSVRSSVAEGRTCSGEAETSLHQCQSYAQFLSATRRSTCYPSGDGGVTSQPQGQVSSGPEAPTRRSSRGCYWPSMPGTRGGGANRFGFPSKRAEDGAERMLRRAGRGRQGQYRRTPT